MNVTVCSIHPDVIHPDVMRRVGPPAFLAVCLVVGCTSAFGQAFPSTDFPHTSGSLNLVLANKNGFVIAADSRGTHRTSTGVSYRDEYQKLFRTGPRSALAIAGL